MPFRSDSEENVQAKKFFCAEVVMILRVLRRKIV